MNIGVDFDGVLFDTEGIYRTLSQIYNLKIGGRMIEPEKYGFKKDLIGPMNKIKSLSTPLY